MPAAAARLELYTMLCWPNFQVQISRLTLLVNPTSTTRHVNGPLNPNSLDVRLKVLFPNPQSNGLTSKLNVRSRKAKEPVDAVRHDNFMTMLLSRNGQKLQVVTVSSWLQAYW